ncbi:hypothetical protein C0989_007627 [Termitomyces sp. Mn162]|nr:hypothetical protein C0989_007627 [Termitomyces sp. Mn162]
MAKEKWQSGGYNPPDGKDLVPIQVLRFITAFDIISDDLILRAKTETNDEVSLPKVKFGAVVDTDILEWPTFYDGIMGLGTQWRRAPDYAGAWHPTRDTGLSYVRS